MKLSDEREEVVRRLEVIWRAYLKQPKLKGRARRWHIAKIALAWSPFGTHEQNNNAARYRAARFLATIGVTDSPDAAAGSPEHKKSSTTTLSARLCRRNGNQADGEEDNSGSEKSSAR